MEPRLQLQVQEVGSKQVSPTMPDKKNWVDPILQMVGGRAAWDDDDDGEIVDDDGEMGGDDSGLDEPTSPAEVPEEVSCQGLKASSEKPAQATEPSKEQVRLAEFEVEDMELCLPEPMWLKPQEVKLVEEGQADPIALATGTVCNQLRPFESESLQIPEAAHLRSKLDANPRLFEEWMLLIQLAEERWAEAELKMILEGVLKEFPLCWGFWKKLADLEGKEKGPMAAVNVYEKAVAVASPCVDLWVHFTDAARSAGSERLPEETVRELFERGISAAGLDWRAHTLWLRYIDFEEAAGRWQRAGALYRRALRTPTQGLANIRVRLRALVVGDSCPPMELLCGDSPAELKLLQTLQAPKPESSGPHSIKIILGQREPGQQLRPTERVPRTFTTAPQQVEDGELEDGEIQEQPLVDKLELMSRSVASQPAPDPTKMEQQHREHAQIQKQLQQQVQASIQDRQHTQSIINETTGYNLPAEKRLFLRWREELYQKTMAECQLLQEYESRLPRHYFHGKPLGDAQLEGWRLYLAFEEARQEPRSHRLHSVYQRCLVVANNYVEFWLRYAGLLEQCAMIAAPPAEGVSPKPERACELISSACMSGRLRCRPDALNVWAELEEFCGRPERATMLLDSALQGCGKGCLELMLRRVALELRGAAVSSFSDEEKQQAQSRGADLSQVMWRCDTLFTRYIAQTTQLVVLSFLARRQAKLCEEDLNRPDLAHETLTKAWFVGCRDSALVFELASFMARRGCTLSAPPAALGQGNALCGFSKLGLDAGVQLFEEAVNTVTKMGEGCILWGSYVDFCLTYGASVDVLCFAQQRSRAFRLSNHVFAFGMQAQAGAAPAEAPEQSLKRSGETLEEGQSAPEKKLCLADRSAHLKLEDIFKDMQRKK